MKNISLRIYFLVAAIGLSFINGGPTHAAAVGYVRGRSDPFIEFVASVRRAVNELNLPDGPKAPTKELSLAISRGLDIQIVHTQSKFLGWEEALPLESVDRKSLASLVAALKQPLFEQKKDQLEKIIMTADINQLREFCNLYAKLPLPSNDELAKRFVNNSLIN